MGDQNRNNLESLNCCEATTVNDVKARSRDQREASQGEPTCVICRRYGEYICDETDDDICSLECKQTLLCRIPKPQSPPARRFPSADECFYVRDTPNLQPPHRKEGDPLVAPALSFSDCNLPQKLLQNIENAGYKAPTPVQSQAIPAASAGKNLLVSAETGSGKTASFLIPIISRCASRRFEQRSSQKKALAMVLAPTRELCVQVEEQAKLFGKGLPFKTALVIGGNPMAGQLHRIRQGVELIIGTPGRVVDLLSKHDIELDDVLILVLDEVDCMLQKGFREQAMQIFRALSQPQILMYSATLPQWVEKMAGSMTNDMVRVSVGKQNKPTGAVNQIVIWVEPKQKKKKLFDILTSGRHSVPPVIVFVGSRLGADLLSEAITISTGMKALSIHGEKSMEERGETMRSFGSGGVPVLVATGILGRGVDLLRARQVVVFDMPNSIDEYVHQIGRASGVGKEGGRAFVFVNGEDRSVIPELIGILKSSGAAVPGELANSRYAAASFAGGRSGGQKKRRLHF